MSRAHHDNPEIKAIFDKLLQEAKAQSKKPYMTISKGMAGYFCVIIHYNYEYGAPFSEPLESGSGRYTTKAEAEAEGREWAKELGIDYKDPQEI
jgi:hypothetical protein